MSKITELEKELEVARAVAKTWQEAFYAITKFQEVGRQPDKTPKPFSLNYVVEEEGKATNFVNSKQFTDLFKDNPPKEDIVWGKGEMTAQNVWLAWAGRMLWEAVKEQALVFIAKTFEEIKEHGAEWAKSVAIWVLNNLQQWLFEKYQQSHSEEEQKFVKDKIIENYPDSELAKKLQENQ